jgi:hypothetical protein
LGNGTENVTVQLTARDPAVNDPDWLVLPAIITPVPALHVTVGEVVDDAMIP